MRKRNSESPNELYDRKPPVILEPNDYLVLKQNDFGFWITGPECDLPADASDSLIGAWLDLHGMATDEIDRKHKPIVIWTKKGKQNGNG